MTSGILNRRRLIFAAALVAEMLTGSAPSAPAQPSLSVEFFRNMCRDGIPAGELSAMAGGISFGLLTGQSLGGPNRAYCPPNNGRISNAVAGRAVCDVIDKRPNVAGQDIYVAMGVALLQTYPCPAADKK